MTTTSTKPLNPTTAMKSSTGTTMAEVKTELEDYLQVKNLNDIFVDIVENLLIEKPDNAIAFVVQHLFKKYPLETKEVLLNEKEKALGNQRLSAEKSKRDSEQDSTNHNPAPSDDEDSEDEDSEDDDDDDSDSDCSEHYQRRRPQPPSATGGGVRRSSICAEKLSIGKMNSSREINGNSSDSDTLNMDNGNEKKNSTPKTKEESEKITQILKTNVLFQHLDEEQMQKVLNAMFLVQKEQDDVIIQQGDGGDNFYILESGEVNVFIRKDEKMVSNSVSDDPEADGGDNDKSNEQKQHELKYGKLVTTYKNEASFGELAIMYNAPRAATCVAVNGPVRLWALDRVSFKVILMQTAISTRETNKGFLQNVPILSDLTMYELLTIADSLVEESFSNGATIFKEGDHGDKFYIIKEGVAVCSKVNNATEKSIEVARLKEGAYFGEIALVTPKRRQATVTASGNLKCLTLDRKTFKRVMGPIEQILMRNIENYNKFQAANI